MTEILSFPGLGLEIPLNRVAFEIGPLTVYWYGIFAATGIMLGLLYAMKRSGEFGLTADDVSDVFLYGAIGGIVGARLYFVAFSWENYKDDLLSIFEIWNGGIAIYGGLIGGMLVGVYVAKRKRLPVLALVDVFLTAFLLGQGIGRWGNFVNIEAFGSNTTLPWGMTSPSIVAYLTRQSEELASQGVFIDPSMPVHPTFFYESAWCIIGFLLIATLTKKRRFDGEITLFYCIWYGAERFVVEGLRTDSLMLGNIRISQMLSGFAVIIAAIIWIYVKNKIKKANDNEYLIPYGHSKEYKDKLLENILATSTAGESALETIVQNIDLTKISDNGDEKEAVLDDEDEAVLLKEDKES